MKQKVRVEEKISVVKCGRNDKLHIRLYAGTG